MGNVGEILFAAANNADNIVQSIQDYTEGSSDGN